MSAAALPTAGAARPAAPVLPSYRGRFAPSPTGPLHFGSLVAALGSFLRARQARGAWTLRIEDIDPPREAPGAADAILRALERHGLHWDGPVMYQNTRRDAYEAALDRLRDAGWLYACTCTRSEIAASGRQGPFGTIYPGSCRNGPVQSRPQRALRVRTHERPIRFTDRIQGVQTQRLLDEIGDFVVRRADGLFAYQLAVVIDDDSQGITEVVRGADLLSSTARQIHLQQALGLRTPDYAHLPVAVDERGEKLSKQTHAAPLDERQAAANLWKALAFLGQAPPRELRRSDPAEVLAWAADAWRLEAVPKTLGLRPPET